jgi:hypothetical protein
VGPFARGEGVVPDGPVEPGDWPVTSGRAETCAELRLGWSEPPAALIPKADSPRARTVNGGLTLNSLKALDGHRTTLAGFWPHENAQRCQFLRIAGRCLGSSTGM